jgi:CubicO group peptidase (beta-lactamase class C family)
MTNGRLVQAFVALLASGPVHADALDHAVNEVMKKNNVPGAVVLVARDGKVLKRAAYGLASVELSTALKADHVFPLASITKVFTATAVLLLVQEGKLRLEQSIGEVLPDPPAAWRTATIKQALSHSTGLPDIFEDDSPVPIAWTQDELFQKLQSRPLQYEPGTKSRYEQTDYVLLRMAVERLTGGTLQDFVQARIFRAAEMKSAMYGDYRDVVPGRVAFYWRYPPAADRTHVLWADGKVIVSPDKLWNNPFFYAAYDLGGVGLNMNADDLAKFDAALWQGRLLKRDLLEEMVKPIILPSGKRAPFALGWQVGPTSGDRLVYHDGAGALIYAHDMDANLTFIVMTNCNGGRPSQILRQLLSKYAPSARWD